MSGKLTFALALLIALCVTDSARAANGLNGGPLKSGGHNTAGSSTSSGNNLPGPQTPTPTPAPTPPTQRQRLRFSNPGLRPDDPATRTSNLAVERALDRLSNPQPTPAPITPEPGKEVKEVKDMTTPACDGWFCNPSIFTEYDFVTSADKRTFGSDSHTNAFSLGGDFFTKGNVLAGFIYTFNDQDDHAAILKRRADEYTNLISLYMAKNIGNWVNLGVAGGYGYTRVNETLLGPGGFSTSFSDNQWNIAPFVGVAHTWGGFSASLTTTYVDEWDRFSGSEFTRGIESRTDLFEFTLRLGYALTDKWKVEGYSSYVQAIDAPSASFFLPEDHNWWVFGGKISYQAARSCQVYVGYEYDAFNESYVDHTVRAGLNFSF